MTGVGRDLRPPVFAEVTDAARTRDTATKLRQRWHQLRQYAWLALNTTGLAMQVVVLETDIVLALAEDFPARREAVGLLVKVTGEDGDKEKLRAAIKKNSMF